MRRELRKIIADFNLIDMSQTGTYSFGISLGLAMGIIVTMIFVIIAECLLWM